MSKANSSQQLELLLPELCFPGRDVVTIREVAAKLSFTDQHIINLCEDPDSPLLAIDGARKNRAHTASPSPATTPG